MSEFGRWHIELNIHPHPDPAGRGAVMPGFTDSQVIYDQARWRFEAAGRPDSEKRMFAVVCEAIDAAGWLLDPERIDEMKASIRLTREGEWKQ